MDDNKHDSTNAVTANAANTKTGMISTDIKSALEKSLAAWDQLTQECSGGHVLGAEEKRMEEMKSLLKDLKSKLDELSL